MTEGPIAGDPIDLDRIADALEGAGEWLTERNEHLAAMQDAVAKLTISTDALVLAVTANVQRNRQFRWTMLAIGILALVGIYAAVHVSNSNHEVVSRIESCTTPGGGADHGACYARAQAGTAAAVATLEQQFARDVAAAIVCARSNTDFDHVLACVEAAAGKP